MNADWLWFFQQETIREGFSDLCHPDEGGISSCPPRTLSTPTKEESMDFFQSKPAEKIGPRTFIKEEIMDMLFIQCIDSSFVGVDWSGGCKVWDPSFVGMTKAKKVINIFIDSHFLLCIPFQPTGSFAILPKRKERNADERRLIKIETERKTFPSRTRS